MTTTINQRVYRIGELAAATQLTPVGGELLICPAIR